jgi:hypothetical protein
MNAQVGRNSGEKTEQCSRSCLMLRAARRARGLARAADIPKMLRKIGSRDARRRINKSSRTCATGGSIISRRFATNSAGITFGHRKQNAAAHSIAFTRRCAKLRRRYYLLVCRGRNSRFRHCQDALLHVAAPRRFWAHRRSLGRNWVAGRR